MKDIIALALALVVVIFGASGGSGQKLSDSKPASLDQVIDIDLPDTTVAHALDILAVEHRVPIGFEEAIGNPSMQIHLQSGALRSILDSLVAQEPKYKWELRDGVINVTPVVGRDEILAQLLNIKIARFIPPKGTDKFKLRDAVLASPEVKQFLEANKVPVLPYVYTYGRSIYFNDKVDLRISNTDVRGVLNHIARESEHKIWSIERDSDKKSILLTY
jgi:hypothetical protein